MKRDNITKKILKDKIYFNIGVPNSISKEILDLFFEIIIEGLIKDGEVKISKFGKFKILNKKERLGRNPKTLQEFTISKRKVVSFYPSAYAKKKLNEKEQRSL